MEEDKETRLEVMENGEGIMEDKGTRFKVMENGMVRGLTVSTLTYHYYWLRSQLDSSIYHRSLSPHPLHEVKT